MFRERSTEKELMDGETDEVILVQNYHEIERVNTLLGGYNTLYNGLTYFRNKGCFNGKVHLLDVGCGAGDNIAAILKWGIKHNVALQITGVDLSETAINMAKTRFKGHLNVHLIHSDYRDLNMTESPDIIVTSLFNHHLTDTENVYYFNWAKNLATMGFIVNDLHRKAFAYYAIKIISVLANTSRYFKNDAPLSVLRAFKKDELLQLAKEAHIQVEVKWQWAFRWLLIYEK